MPGNGEVTIIVAGEDQSGAVMQAVEQNLARIQTRAAAAGNAIATAGHHAVTEMDATRGVVRLMDADFTRMMRIEEIALSKIPGFAAAAKVAFPAIGALAIADGIYRLGKEAYDATEKLEKMGDTIRTEFGDSNLSFEKGNDDLALTNARLEEAIEKLEGKPRNGLAEALAEARVRADELALSLIQDNEKMSQLMEKNSIGTFGGAYSNQLTTAPAEAIQNRYTQRSREIIFAGQQAEASAKTADEAKTIRIQTQNQLYALQTRTLTEISDKLRDVAKQQADAKRWTEEANAQAERNGMAPSFRGAPDSSALTNDLQGYYGFVLGQRDRTTLTGQNDDLVDHEKRAQEAHDASEAQRASARQAAEAQREARREAQDTLNRAIGSGAGSSQTAVLARASRLAKIEEEAQKQSTEVVDRAVEARTKLYQEEAEARVKYSAEQIAALRQVQEGRIRGASDQYGDTERDTEFGVRTGKISSDQRYAALRAAATQEYEIKRNALEQIKELDSANPNDPQKVQADLNQITELQSQYSRQMVSLTQQQYEQQRTAAEGYISSILDPLMTGTESISKRFKKMADDITEQLARIAEKKATASLADVFMDGGRQGSGSGMTNPAAPKGGIGAALGGLLGGLFGRRQPGGVTSNGGLMTSAGTVPDAITSGLKQGAGSGGSGVTVNIMNQGTPQQATSSGSSGGGGLEPQVISIIMKDADTLGPMTKALSGAMGMLPQF